MKYRLKNDKLDICISSRGAELRAIVRDGFNYLWNGNPQYWEECAPILFPYNGRMTNNQYTFNGKTYLMGIHGFARMMEHELVEQKENLLKFQLKSDEQTRANYPFDFVLTQQYELVEDTIVITYSVQNVSDETIYFGIGGHPGFNVPFDGAGDFSDYYLEFTEPCQPQKIGFTDAGYLNGEDRPFHLKYERILPMTHSMFDHDSIFLRHMDTQVTLKSECTKRSVTVTCPDFPLLGLWHAAKTEAPYICIEPWTSLPARQDVVEDLRLQSDLVRLRAHKKYVNQWSIQIK